MKVNATKLPLKIKQKTNALKVTGLAKYDLVATVTSKGVIKTRKKGTAVITVKSGRKTIKCKFTVK